MDRGWKAARDTGLGQQPLRLLDVIAGEVSRLRRVDLLGGELPFRHGAGDGPGVQAALAEVQRVPPGLAVDGESDGAADAHVVERGLIRAHVDVREVDDHLRGDHHLRVRALQCATFLGRQPAPPVRELQLPGPQQRQPGRLVRHDVDGETVEVRETRHVVVRIPLVDRAHAPLVGAEHERPGADHRLGRVQVLELVVDLARHDRAVRGIGEVVQQRCEGLAKHEADGVAVQHVDGLHGLEARAQGRLRAKPLQRELDVLGGDLAAVDRRLLVKADALAQREHQCGRGRVLPLLRDVRHDPVIGGVLRLRPRRKADEVAVNGARVQVGREPCDLVGVEARGLRGGHVEDSAAFRCLRRGRCGAGGHQRRDDQHGEQAPRWPHGRPPW